MSTWTTVPCVTRGSSKQATVVATNSEAMRFRVVIAGLPGRSPSCFGPSPCAPSRSTPPPIPKKPPHTDGEADQEEEQDVELHARDG